MTEKLLKKEELVLLEKIKEIAPDCVNEDGKLDIRKLAKKMPVGTVFEDEERTDFNFLGKNYARMLASVETETVIVPDTEHNSNPENANSQNIYISGDNLDALKHLLKSYEGKVKCIYIDPPYNTGSDGFVYNDTFNYTSTELAEKLGVSEEKAKKILNMTTRGSSSDSAWLTFMLSRLLLAKDMLTEDGVIFISIDDNEQANLKLLCDDVFGSENFVANIIIQSNKRGQTYKQLAKTHEYLFAITKNSNVVLNQFEKSEGSFSKTDAIGDFEERELRNRNPKYGRFNRPNLFYPIYTNPNIIDECGFSPISLEKSNEFNVEILPYNSEGEESCWRWSKEKLNRFNDNTDSMQSDVVAKQKNTGEYGCYEKYRKDTFKPKTIWYNDDIIGDLIEEDDDIWSEKNVINEKGSKELFDYKMKDSFSFPKPTDLIKKAFLIGSDSNSLCMDFFSGSASSFDALLSLNANGSNRKIIAVQLPENFDEALEKAGKSEKEKIRKIISFLDSIGRPHTLDQIGIERIKRAAQKIRKEHPDTTADLGFKHFTLKAMPKDRLENLEKFDPNAAVLNDNNLNAFGTETLLTTWMERDGYGLTSSAEQIDFDGYKGYRIGTHLYLLHSGLTNSAVKAIVEKYNSCPDFGKIQNIVLFEYGFSYGEVEALKRNLISVGSKLGIAFNFEKRF